MIIHVMVMNGLYTQPYPSSWSCPTAMNTGRRKTSFAKNRIISILPPCTQTQGFSACIHHEDHQISVSNSTNYMAMQAVKRASVPPGNTRPAVTPATSIDRIARRGLLAGFASIALTGSAVAKDLKEAQAEKEARKKKLRAAASQQKETGQIVEAFETPEYSVSEEARTPNFRARQSEGTRVYREETRARD